MGVRGPGFAILARVAVVGDDGGDAGGRRPLQRVDQDQQLHQVVVGRERDGLDHEDVLAADVLLDLDEDLHVREALHLPLGRRDLEVGADRLGERPVGVAGDELHGQLTATVSGPGIERHGTPPRPFAGRF